MRSDLLAASLALVLLVGTALLAARSNLLRDSSTARRGPFSFARVQLLWWTLIVALCLLQHYGETYELVALNQTCLALLGIGVGTKMIAQVIDTRQRQTAELSGTAVIQDKESEGFLTDILSDENGLSVHRLQALVFNVLYGVTFVSHFVNTGGFADYDTVQYAVLGLSSAGYLGLKALENNPKNQLSTGASRAGGDELLDGDVAAGGPAASG
ncbi:MAG TPA: hypothetical protein VE046_01750 [Steroidobacteraceae bacterium]|nr:hypothetical protein [Steroidobacteraceae bacterium]